MKETIQLLFELQSLEFGDAVPASAQGRIAQLREQVPAPVLSHYDRLGNSGKRGVAAVRNHACSGCHIRLPLATIMELKRPDTVKLCENCRRYLYLPPETEAVIPPLPPKKQRRTPRRELAAAV